MKTVPLAFAALLALAQDDVKVPDHRFIAPDEMRWMDAPPAVPPGAKFAVIEGDLAKPGPFTVRMKFPDGYKIAPHSHPGLEHVTVLSGTFHIGAGETWDASKAKALGPGGFAMMDTGLRHFAWTRGETIVQVHGMGPWGITYANPADDPRTSSK